MMVAVIFFAVEMQCSSNMHVLQFGIRLKHMLLAISLSSSVREGFFVFALISFLLRSPNKKMDARSDPAGRHKLGQVQRNTKRGVLHLLIK